MANAFQKMLEHFRLTKKILALNADNATSNDTQTTRLHELNNSFNKENHVRCFNHTLQLSAKTLLKPFNIALAGKGMDNDDGNDDDIAAQDEGSTLVIEDDSEEEGEDEGIDADSDIEDDNVDKLQELSENKWIQVLEETAVICETVTKVYEMIFTLYTTN